MLYSFATFCGLCVALLFVVSFLLQPLTKMEAEILQLARVFHVAWAPHQTVEQWQDRESDAHQFLVSAFSEFNRIFGAIQRLSRALYTLRAFSPTGIPLQVVALVANADLGTTASPSFSQQSTVASHASAFFEIPYTSTLPGGGGGANTWRVPVTTMFVEVDPSTFHPRVVRDSSGAIVERHKTILDCLHKHTAVFAGGGGYIGHFFGDRFMMHFQLAFHLALHRQYPCVGTCDQIHARC